MYSLGVFSGYYFYTKLTTPETVKIQDFEEFREDTDKVTDLFTGVLMNSEEQSSFRSLPSCG